MTVGRLLGVVVAGASAVLVGAQPASAHTVTGVAATNYRSRITSVSPEVPGIEVRLLDLGRRVQLTNRQGSDVVVLGYFGEPYLRVGPSGAYENRRSPSAYKNRPPPAGVTPTTLPVIADATAPPDWHRMSGGRSVRWRDQRTRWEGADPPAVERSPDRAHTVVPSWTIQLRRGDAPVLVSGQVDWVPGPRPWAWLGLALVLALLCLAMAATRSWGPLLGAAMAVLVATDVVHGFATAAASGDSVGAQLVRVLFGGLMLTGGWVIGIWSVGALQQRRHMGLVAGGMAAFVIALYSGFGDGPTLVRSQVPFVFPGVVARFAVSAALGLGVGLVVACIVVDRRLGRQASVRAGPMRGTSTGATVGGRPRATGSS